MQQQASLLDVFSTLQGFIDENSATHCYYCYTSKADSPHPGRWVPIEESKHICSDCISRAGRENTHVMQLVCGQYADPMKASPFINPANVAVSQPIGKSRVFSVGALRAVLAPEGSAILTVGEASYTLSEDEWFTLSYLLDMLKTARVDQLVDHGQGSALIQFAKGTTHEVHN